MARISRKITNSTHNIHQEVITLFKTAIYVRLSIEDNGHGTSDTIENQIHMLQDYVSEDNSMQLIDIYCDNGVTGTSFDRPEFNRMICDVYSRRINCIVVKDLSRLGRNFIEGGNYIERIFPSLQVRFIAVNDGLDSAKDNIDFIMIAFKNLMNEFYVRDISKKSKSSLRLKQKEGKYLGGRTPYGYIRDKNDKYKLIPDPETAPIVQDIFQRRMEGASKLSIAKYMNTQEIFSPERYRYEKGMIKKKDCPNPFWAERTIHFILCNPIYIGQIAYGKFQKKTFGQKRQKPVPREEWRVNPGIHEAIIKEEIFKKVSQMTEDNKQKWKNCPQKNNIKNCSKENILKNLTYCGYCKAKAIRVSEKNYSRVKKTVYNYRCSNHIHFYDKVCIGFGRIKEDRTIISILETLLLLLKLISFEQNKLADTVILNYDEKLQDIVLQKQNLLSKYGEGQITDKDFIAKKRELIEIENLWKKQTNQRTRLKEKTIETIRKENGNNQFFSTFIQRIEFYNSKKLIIKLKFSLPFYCSNC